MNIFIFGANWYNRGDESAIRALIDELKINKPECMIKIHFNQRVTEIPYEDIEIIPPCARPRRRDIPGRMAYNCMMAINGRVNLLWNRKKKEAFAGILKTIDWADIAVFAPGGPTIGDIYRQYHLVDFMKLMSYKKTPFVIYAPSMGPFKYKRRYIRKIVDRAEFITFREKISQGLYAQISPGKITTVTIDSAFQHDINKDKYAMQFERDTALRSFFSTYQNIVGITITDLEWHTLYKGTGLCNIIRETFARFINYLDDKKYGVIFIPQLFGKDHDKEYMESYATDKMLVLDEKYDCYFQQYLISRCHAVVGMRYHSNIFSAKMGTPFVSVAYEQKMKGFMEDNGLSNYCIGIEELCYDKVLLSFKLLEKNYEEYRNYLSRQEKMFRERSFKNTQSLLHELDRIKETKERQKEI